MFGRSSNDQNPIKHQRALLLLGSSMKNLLAAKRDLQFERPNKWNHGDPEDISRPFEAPFCGRSALIRGLNVLGRERKIAANYNLSWS